MQVEKCFVKHLCVQTVKKSVIYVLFLYFMSMNK